MAKLSFSTKCPCGAQIEGGIKKPTLSVPTVSKINCKKCGSRFLMFSARSQSEEGRRVFTTDFEVIELSERAQAIVAAKAPRKSKANDFKIETDLDEKAE